MNDEVKTSGVSGATVLQICCTIIIVTCLLVTAGVHFPTWHTPTKFALNVSALTPRCSKAFDTNQFFVTGIVENRNTFEWIERAGVVLAYGPEIRYLTTDDLGTFGVNVPGSKRIRVQILEVLVPTKDGTMTPVSGPMPSVTCRPDADDGDDQ